MLLAVILFGPGLPAAFGVTLAWNASTDTSVTAYALHYGTVSGKLTTTVEAGKATTVSVATLSPGTTYYFNVVARNGAGVESMPSSEVSYTVPGTPTPNRPPTLNALGNLTVIEDAPAQSVALSGIGSGSSTESQTLTVTASSSNTGLIPTPSISYSSPNSTGTLTFTPAPNASGTATLSVTVNDGQAQSNTITRSFTVTVSAANDSPTLNAVSNLSLSTNAGPQTVALSGIGSGAANESQTLVVTASQNNPSLLSGLSVSYTSPAATGTLAFTPVAGATGTATITVSVNDGAAANNVVSRSFTVTVSTNTSRTLFLEAESGTLTSPMVTSSDAQASNGQRVSSPTAETGSVDLALNITQAGDYYAWCRVLSSDAGKDSFYVSLDAGVADIFDTMTNYSSAWQWVQLKGRTLGTPRVLTLSQGTHHLVFKCREAQTLLDAIYLSTDRNFVPSGASGASGASVNRPPTLNALSNLTLSEDALTQTVALSGIGSGSSTESQSLAVTAVSSNPGLIPNPTVSYASPSATGSLSFKPVANGSGTTTITVTVNDGQSVSNLFSRSFLVIVNPVNDAPVVNAGADRSVTLPATLALAGSVTDDAPGWTAAWSKVSGPGSVTFSPSGNPVCTAGFSLPGTYVLRLTANDGALSASDDLSVTVLAAGDVTGPVVSGLRVAGNNARGFTLAWTTDESGSCAVEYGPTSALGSTSAMEGTSSTSHQMSVTGLVAATTYYTRVRSRDTLGNVSFSSIGTVTTAPVNVFAWAAEAGTLTAPMSLLNQANAVGGQVVVSATDDAGSAAFPLNVTVTSDYQLWCRLWSPAAGVGSFYVSADGSSEAIFDTAVAWTNSFQWVSLNARAGSVPLVVNPRVLHLDQGQRTVRFRTHDAGVQLDECVLSNDPNWRPGLTGSAPVLTVTAVSSNRVDLAWTDTLNNEDGFQVDWSTEGVNWAPLVETDPGTTSFQHQGLWPGMTAYYRVFGFSQTDRTDYSPVVIAHTTALPPAAPSNLTATQTGTGTVQVSWVDRSSDELGFVLERSLDGTSFSTIQTPPANATSAVDAVSSRQRIYYRVHAYNAAGNSANSNTDSVRVR